MKKASDKQDLSSRRRRAGCRALVCVLFHLLAAGTVRAERLEVLQPGLFQVGNTWTFDSQTNGTVFVMTWTINTGSGSGTFILRESAPSQYVDDITTSFSQPALLFLRVNDQRLTSPTQTIVSDYSGNPLEKIPCIVYTTDTVARAFGQGVATVTRGSQKWTRTEDQSVTFLRRGTVDVPAGTIDCVTIQVDEAWRYDNGWTGTRKRTYSLNRLWGPVVMDYVITDRDANGAIVSQLTSTHRLKNFTPAVPDLTAEQISFPASVQWGQPLTISWKETSRHKGTTKAHQTSVYLVAANSQVTSKPVVLIPALQIPVIGQNQTYSATVTTNTTNAIRPGAYYVALSVDSYKEITELDESNFFVSAGTLNVIARPDLRVTAGGFAPSSLGPGDVLRTTGTITNIGGATASPSWTHVYLSTDALIDLADYPLISGIQTPALSSNTSATFSRSIAIPAALPEGSYYLGIICDVDNAIAEFDETNNVRSLTGTLFVARADLKAESIGFSPTVIQPGDTVNISGTIRNAGGAVATTTSAQVWLSTDRVKSANDFLLIDNISVPLLAGSARFSFKQNVSVPVEGVYYVLLAADVGGLVNENATSKTNNLLFTTTTLGVGTADLQVSGGSVSPSPIEPGQQISVQAGIKNGGLFSAAASVANIYLSSDNVITVGDTWLPSSQDCPALAPGDTFTINVIRTIPTTTTAGLYYLGVICDVTNKVKESNKANNAQALPGALRVRGPALTAVRRWTAYP